MPPKALACPECGADENAGWNDIGYVGGGLSDPEDVFGQEDYRAAFDREFGEVVKPDGIKPIWWITGIVLLAIFLYGALRSFL